MYASISCLCMFVLVLSVYVSFYGVWACVGTIGNKHVYVHTFAFEFVYAWACVAFFFVTRRMAPSPSAPPGNKLCLVWRANGGGN